MKKFLISLFCLTLLSNAFAQSEVVGEAPNDTIEVKQDLAKNAEYFSKGIEAKYNENYEVAIWNFEQALRRTHV